MSVVLVVMWIVLVKVLHILVIIMSVVLVIAYINQSLTSFLSSGLQLPPVLPQPPQLFLQHGVGQQLLGERLHLVQSGPVRRQLRRERLVLLQLLDLVFQGCYFAWMEANVSICSLRIGSKCHFFSRQVIF